jgi:hypothetical protein
MKAKHRHYSPPISRFLVSVLYHEAKTRGVPMTKLTDHLLRQALTDSSGWQTAENLREQEAQYQVPPANAA